jgi:hypothetical protein
MEFKYLQQGQCTSNPAGKASVSIDLLVTTLFQAANFLNVARWSLVSSLWLNHSCGETPINTLMSYARLTSLKALQHVDSRVMAVELLLSSAAVAAGSVPARGLHMESCRAVAEAGGCGGGGAAGV